MDMYGQWNQQYAGMDPAAAAQAQQMYWQQYYGYGPPQPFYGYGAPPTVMPPSMPSVPPSTVGGPIPPVEPPKEEQPPLPAEPPPEEEKTHSDEQHKLSTLQMQAAQWQQQKQWEEYQKNLLQYQQNLQQWTSQQAVLLDQVTKEEVEFENQYSDWVKQYNDWKEQNKNHPNKDQYQQYEQQWKQYEEQMSQKRDFIQQRKRTLLQNQQPSHLTAPTAPSDYMAPQPTAVSAAASVPAVTSTAYPAVASAPVAASYTSSMYGSSAAVQAPPSVAPPQYDYTGHSTYPVVPPPVSAAVPPVIPGYPASQAPAFGSVPSNFPARYPPPSMPGYGAGYGYHGMMMPPPDQAFGSITASKSADVTVSAWNATSTGGQSNYGQQSGYVQSGGQTSTVSSAQSLGTTPASGDSSSKASNFFGQGSSEPSSLRPMYPAGGPPSGSGPPHRFGNQNDQRWPVPVNTSSTRPPGPNYGKKLETFDDSGQFAEESHWQNTGFEQNVTKIGSGPRPGGPGGFGPGNFGPRSDMDTGLRGPRPDAIGIGGPRGPRPNVGASGPRPLMMSNARPMGNRPRWQGEAVSYDEDGAPIEQEPESEAFGEEADQTGKAGMNFGQPGPRFPTPGFNQAGYLGRGVRPGMGEARGGPLPRGVRPVLSEGPGGPRGIRPGFGEGPRAMRPGFGEGSMLRNVRPGFGEVPGGSMIRPGWSGQGGPRMRFGGPAEEQSEYGEENVPGNEQIEENYDEENFGKGDEYGPDDSAIDEGYRGRFGAPGQPGLRPSGMGFPQQRPFGMQRPRMEMRPQGIGFGPRGYPGPGVGAPPRGPIPLMGIRIRAPSQSDVSSADKQDANDYRESEEFQQDEEMVDYGDFEKEIPSGPSGQPGIRPLGQLGPRPRMAGPRGFMGEQRQMEPGSNTFQPRGQRLPDIRGSQIQRFPGPRGPGGPGPRGLPQGFDVGQRPQRPGMGDMAPGQRGPRPLFGESQMGQRPTRPGFGDQQGRFPRGPFPHGQRMSGPPRFGGPFTDEYYGDEGFDGEVNLESTEYDNQGDAWDHTETRGDKRMQQQEKSEFPGRNAGPSVAGRSVEGQANTNKPLKLSEHEHDLIKKATEELMQKKLPPLDIISKFVSPLDTKAAGGATKPPTNSGDQRKEFNNEEMEPIGERFSEGFGAGRGRDGEFSSRFDDFPGPFDRRGFPLGRLDEPSFPDDRNRDRGFPPTRDHPFPPDRMLPHGDRPFPPQGRPFPDDRRFGAGRDMQDPEAEFHGPPRRGLDGEPRGPHWANRFGIRGAGDDDSFRGGEEREFRGPRDDPFFRGPRDGMTLRGPSDERNMHDLRGEFGFRGPLAPEFDPERRLFEDRGPHRLDWERGEPRFDRGGKLSRLAGGPRDLFDQDEFPMGPPSFGRGRPPSLMDLGRPGPEPATVIDYGHGQPDSLGADERRFRDENVRRRDDRWDGGDLNIRGEREPNRPLPSDTRRSLRDEGRRRSRSRSPPFIRDDEQHAQGRGHFERSTRERSGRDRESDRPAPGGRGGHDGDRQGPGGRGGLDSDRSRQSNDENNRKRERELERPVADIRSFDSFPLGPSRLPPPRPAAEEIRKEITAVDDLLVAPRRHSRPDHLVVIIRGPPGSGKTYVSKLLKDKEVANGGKAPRMLCLDDYFVVEVEKTVTEPDTGRKVKKMVMEYEYDAAMEPAYRISFLKSFKRQIDDCFFSFIIVDAVFDKAVQLEEFWSYAKSKGFQVYIVEMQADLSTCVKRNTHQRSQADIQKVFDGWEETPKHYIRLDVRSILQEAAIEDVEMEDTTIEKESDVKSEDAKVEKKEEEEDMEAGYVKSKWELDTSEQHLG